MDCPSSALFNSVLVYLALAFNTNLDNCPVCTSFDTAYHIFLNVLWSTVSGLVTSSTQCVPFNLKSKGPSSATILFPHIPLGENTHHMRIFVGTPSGELVLSINQIITRIYHLNAFKIGVIMTTNSIHNSITFKFAIKL